MVRIHLYSQSHPKEYINTVNSYTKDGMYCVSFKVEGGLVVHKYPMVNIFRVEEED